MKHSHGQVSRWVALGAYVFALSLVAGPAIDLFTTVLPARFGDVSWRYGFMGLAAGYLHTPLIGLGLASTVAVWQGDMRVVRALGLGMTLAAVLLIPLMGTWVLDVLQMRELREPDARSGVLIGGVIQGTKYLLACVALMLAGLGLTRTANAGAARASARAEKAGSPGSLRSD